ncbi:MAG: hypothetical protein KF683_13075 [Rubrivivax sp.]|nr:hypothetical protein [Rubrivivax sp.]
MADEPDARSTFEQEHRVRQADGSVGWLLSRAVPVPGPDGEVAEWFGAGSDATVRRRATARRIGDLKRPLGLSASRKPEAGLGGGPKAMRQVMAAACVGRSVRASSPSASGSPRQVWPMSSTSTPWRVSSFISRAMTVCSSACNSSSLGTLASMKPGKPSASHRYTPQRLP